MEISIKTPNPRDWIALFENAQKEFSQGMVKFTRVAGEVALIAVKDGTPKDSGETASKWFLREEQSRSSSGQFTSGITVTIDHPFNKEGAVHSGTNKPVNTSNFKLLEALEYGTKAHDIPLPKGFLAFTTKSGELIIRRMFKVHVKGIKAFGMLRKANVIGQKVIQNMAEELANAVLAKMNAGV